MFLIAPIPESIELTTGLYAKTLFIIILKSNPPAAIHTIKNPTIGLGCLILQMAAIKSQTVKPQIINIEAKAPKTSNL